jgi:hypothetical protein
MKLDHLTAKSMKNFAQKKKFKNTTEIGLLEIWNSVYYQCEIW